MTTYVPPNFVKGEMPTVDKLNFTAQEYASSSQAIATLIGNVFYNNIPNLGGTIGDIAKFTATPGSPSTPAIFDLTNPYVNLIRISMQPATQGNTYNAHLQDSKLIASANIISGAIVNTVLVKMSGPASLSNPPYVVRAYEATFEGALGSSNVTVSSSDVGGDFLSDPTNFAFITAGQSLADIVSQTVSNIGNMSFSSGNNNTLTDEINSIENKMFYTFWKVTLPIASATTTTNLGLTVKKWTWASLVSEPDASTAIAYLANGAYLQNMVAASDPYCQSTNTASNSYLRSKCFYNGVPILRPNSQYNTGTGYAAVYAPVRVDSGEIFIVASDIVGITTGNIVAYIPVNVPFKYLQSWDLSNKIVTEMWNGVMANVIGINYFTSGSAIPPIDVRLNSLSTRTDYIRQALLTLTSLHNNSPSYFDPPTWPTV
jgi:hypothetical protein